MASEKNLYDVVIAGGGPAGLTAALYLARARYRVVVVEKDTFGGQITITSEVVNYPGVPRVGGAELGETMRRQAESFGAEFLLAEAVGLDLEGDVKTVRTTRGDLRCFGVLMAAGARPRTVGFVGEEEFRGRGVAYCATCDGEFFTGREVFVVGGGFAAAEESVFLTKYAAHVTVLVRGADFSCAPSVADEARNHPKITVVPHAELVGVRGDAAVREVRYRDRETGEETVRVADDGGSLGVFVFAGYEPATDLVRGVADLTDDGYVATDVRQRTSVAGLYAAGDVCAKSLRQVVTATGEAALAATELERYVSALQEKTGLVPERPRGSAPAGSANPASVAGSRANVSRETSTPGATSATGAASSAGAGATPNAGSGTDAGAAGGGLFSADMRAQLDTVFSRMDRPLVLSLELDDRPVSSELRAYAEELASLTDKVDARVAADAGSSPSEGSDGRPCVRVLREDGSPTGLAFHGVPGGHEFTSFVLGLYNAAGPGQPLDDAARAAIAGIAKDVDVKVLVSLSCTMCPDTVVAAQRIAAGNEHVTAEAYDINCFPALKDRYNVMSVPCVVVNDGERVSFGKKGVADMLQLLG